MIDESESATKLAFNAMNIRLVCEKYFHIGVFKPLELDHEHYSTEEIELIISLFSIIKSNISHFAYGVSLYGIDDLGVLVFKNSTQESGLMCLSCITSISSDTHLFKNIIKWIPNLALFFQALGFKISYEAYYSGDVIYNFLADKRGFLNKHTKSFTLKIEWGC